MRSLLEQYLEQDWIYHHWPEYQPTDAYGLAEVEYLEQLRQVPSLHSVWRFGAVGVPGISDLDYVVVLDQKWGRRLSPQMVTPEKMSAQSRYIVFHEPYVVNQSLLTRWNWWGNGAVLTHLWGAEAGPALPGPREARLIAAAVLCDLLTGHQPRLFMQTLFTGDMHVRGTLCQINACKHLLRLYGQVTQESTTPWDHFFDGFEMFRAQWFELEPSHRMGLLKHYLLQAILLLFDFIGSFHKTLTESGWFLPGLAGYSLYLPPKHLTVWSNPWSIELAVGRAIEAWRHLRQVAVILPASLALSVLAHTQTQGIVSSFVQRQMGRSSLVLSEWCASLQQVARIQAEMRNAHVAFLQEIGLFQPDSAYFGLGLWPRFVSRNPIHQCPRRLYYSLRKRKLARSMFQIVDPGPTHNRVVVDDGSAGQNALC